MVCKTTIDYFVAGTVTNPVTTKDIIIEADNGAKISAISDITSDQMIGIMAVRAKDADQQANTIGVSGVGYYGLSIEQLQIAGIVKLHIDNTLDPATVLDDPSVFTGKDSISSIDDILNNKAIQSKILQDVTATAISNLTQSGVITGLESASKLAAIVGAATKFNTSQITDWLKNKIPTIPPSLPAFPDIDKLAKSAEYAVTLVSDKSADLLNKITAGVTGAVVKVPTKVSDTIDTAALDAALKDFVGDPNISVPQSKFTEKKSGGIF